MSAAYNADETTAHDSNARAKELQHEAVEEKKLEAQGVLRKDRHPGKSLARFDATRPCMRDPQPRDIFGKLLGSRRDVTRPCICVSALKQP